MRHRRSLCFTAGIVASILLTPVAVSAQSGHNLERPEHWKVRYDGADEAAGRNFVVMRPGWHVYAGSGGLLWDPSRFASASSA